MEDRNTQPACLSGHPVTTEDAHTTLRSLLLDYIEQVPFSTYVERQPSGIERGMTVRGLWRTARSLAHAVEQQRLPQEQPWVLCMEHTQDLVAALWAGILLERDVCMYQVIQTGSSPQRLKEKGRRIAEHLPDALVITQEPLLSNPCVEQLQSASPLVFLDQVPHVPDDHPLPTSSGRQANLYIETSGTTGEPKFGVLPHQRLAERYLLERRPDAVGGRLTLVPFDTITGVAAMLPTRNRMLFLHPDRFASQPLELLHMAQEHGAASLLLNTTFAEHLLGELSRSPRRFNLSQLDTVTFGLEQIVEDTVWRLVDTLSPMTEGDLRLCFGYGSSETGLLTMTRVLPPEEILPPRGSHEPVSVGSPLPGKHLRVVDDQGDVVSCGTTGQVEAHLEYGLLSGYLTPNGSIEPLPINGGWLRTGDLGTIQDGELTLSGRRKSVLIAGGRKIPLSAYDHQLRTVPGVQQPYAAALTVTDPVRRTDQLRLVYAISPTTTHPRSQIETWLREAALRVAPVAVDRVTALEASAFPYTSTGKLRREPLVQLLLERERAEDQPPGEAEENTLYTSSSLNDIEAELAKRWRTFLPGAPHFQKETHFFQAGSDSLGAVAMLRDVEVQFQRRVPMESFFQNPTLGGLADLLQGINQELPDYAAATHQDLLVRQATIMSAWPGTRPHPESLWRVFNPEGTGQPLIWVFQYPEEALALSNALGSDIPLVATHSWHTLVELSYVDTPLIERLTDRLLWDLLARIPQGPVVIGGNCQGGLVALSLARKLAGIGRTPAHLVLQEWSFPARRYEHPVHIIYGSHSPVRPLYEEENRAGSAWPEIFPNTTVHAVDVAHGEFFQSGNATYLAEILTPWLPSGNKSSDGWRKWLAGLLRR